jgi:hypothetical protein
MIFAGFWLLLVGAWWLIRQAAAQSGHRDGVGVRLLLTGEVFVASLITIGLFLGGFGWLQPAPAACAAAFVAAAMFAVGGLMWERRRRSSIDPQDSKLVQSVLPTDGRAFGGLPDRRPLHFSRRRLVSAVLILLLVALCVIVAARSLADPTYEYDALTYHLVFPAKWVQDGAISIVPTWFGDPAPAYAPSATEVYYAWLMLATGDDRLARGGQFIFFPLLLLAAYVLGGELRLRRIARLGACLALGLIPAINAQASTAMVDVAFAAQLAAVAAFALRAGRTRQAVDVVGLMLSCGLLVGTKFIALPYLAALSPLIVWVFYRTSRRGKACSCRVLRSGAAAVMVAGVLAFCVGGYWYVRNWAVTGNPVYPLEVKLGSTVVFSGAYGRAQMENSVFNLRRETDPDAFGRTLWEAVHSPEASEPPTNEQGFVPAFRQWYVGPLGLIAAGWLLALIAALRRSPVRAPHVLFLGGTALAFAVFWYVLPFQQPRFAWGTAHAGHHQCRGRDTAASPRGLDRGCARRGRLDRYLLGRLETDGDRLLARLHRYGGPSAADSRLAVKGAFQK